MATYPGSRFISADVPSSVGNSSLDGMLSRYAVAQGFAPDAVAGGPWTFALPTAQRALAPGGGRVPNFGIDWYDTVHVVPQRIDTGNVTSTQQYQVLFWSAHRQAIGQDPIESVGDDEGLTLEQGPQGPYTWRPLEWTYYQLTVTTQGPVIIDVAYQWPLTGVDDGELVVVGQRLVMLPWSPDWSRGLEERFAWLTDVQQAWDGTEHRVQFRDAPRRRWSYRILATGDGARELEQLVWYWQSRAFGIPVWRDGTALDTPVASGATALPCETALREFDPQGNAVLWASPESFEVVAIEAVNAGELTLERGLVGNWPAGTRVYPLRTARLAPETGTSRPSADVVTADLELDLDAPSTPEPGGAVPESWEGLEVWLVEPNRARPMGISYRRTIDRIDGGTGLWETAAREPRPAIIRGHEHVGRNRAESRELLAFLQRRAGRYAAVRVPTWQIDLRVVVATQASDTEITVREDQYRARFDGQAGRDALLLRHRPTGTRLYRRILSASIDGEGQQTLALDQALGIAAAPEDWRVDWLETVRLEDDEVTVLWRSAEVATIDLPLRRVDA